jgi:hypothetical protein
MRAKLLIRAFYEKRKRNLFQMSKNYFQERTVAVTGVRTNNERRGCRQASTVPGCVIFSFSINAGSVYIRDGSFCLP